MKTIEQASKIQVRKQISNEVDQTITERSEIPEEQNYDLDKKEITEEPNIKPEKRINVQAMNTNPSRHTSQNVEFYKSEEKDQDEKKDNADIAAKEDEESGPFKDRNASFNRKAVKPRQSMSSELYQKDHTFNNRVSFENERPKNLTADNKRRYPHSVYNKRLDKLNMAKVMNMRKNCLDAVEQILQEFNETTSDDKTVINQDMLKIVQETQVQLKHINDMDIVKSGIESHFNDVKETLQISDLFDDIDEDLLGEYLAIESIPDVDFDQIITLQDDQESKEKNKPMSTKFNTSDVVKPNNISETVISINETEPYDPVFSGRQNESEQKRESPNSFPIEKNIGLVKAFSLVTIKEEEGEGSIVQPSIQMNTELNLGSDLLNEDQELMEFIKRKESIISNVKKLGAIKFESDGEKQKQFNLTVTQAFSREEKLIRAVKKAKFKRTRSASLKPQQGKLQPDMKMTKNYASQLPSVTEKIIEHPKEFEESPVKLAQIDIQIEKLDSDYNPKDMIKKQLKLDDDDGELQFDNALKFQSARNNRPGLMDSNQMISPNHSINDTLGHRPTLRRPVQMMNDKDVSSKEEDDDDFFGQVSRTSSVARQRADSVRNIKARGGLRRSQNNQDAPNEEPEEETEEQKQEKKERSLEMLKNLESKLKQVEFKHLDRHSSANISDVIDKWAQDQKDLINKESYLKLYWDMSDEPSRAIKALLMASGIRHEGWAIDRLTIKPKDLACNPEKCVPYLIVNNREVLHYMTEEEKDIVQLDAMIDYIRTMFPSLVSFYPYDYEEQSKIQEALEFNHTILRPAFQLNIEPQYLRYIVEQEKYFTLDQLKDISKSYIEIPKALIKLEEMLRVNGTKYIASDNPSAADFVLFQQVIDMHIVGLEFDQSHTHINSWYQNCKQIKGNKEVYNLFMNSYGDYRSSLGYSGKQSKNARDRLRQHRQQNPNPSGSMFSKLFCCTSPNPSVKRSKIN